MNIDQIIKNKFKEVYSIYEAFLDKIKQMVEDTKSIETEVVLLDVEERPNNEHSDEKKNLVKELFVKTYEIQTLQMDLSRISNELIAYYKVMILAGISTDLNESQLEGLKVLAENTGGLIYAVDKGKVVFKQDQMKDIISKEMRSKGDGPIVSYIESMRTNALYNKIIADNSIKS